MKKIFNFIAVSILFFVVGIACTPKSTTTILWVNSVKVTADAGAAKLPCWQITKQKDLTNPQWEIFYGNIEGFKSKAGFFQKIEVKEVPIPKENILADGSSVNYTLVKVLEEKIDRKWRLNDIWALTAINGKTITVPNGSERPNLSIQLGEMGFAGTDGCNQMMGRIKNVTGNTIEFYELATTMMMCGDMTIPNAFHEALIKSRTYQIKDLELTLLGADKKELLRLRKVD